MDAFVPEYLKARNRKLIFDLFLRYGNLSRADVVSMTNMSFPTVSKSIDYFISKKIILETDQYDTSMKGPGKKRKTLVFNPAAFKAVALSFEGQIAEVGVVDLSGTIYSHTKLPFSDFRSVEKQLELASTVSSLIKGQERSFLGMGIALPTTVNPKTGEIVGYHSINLEKMVTFDNLFSEFLSHVQLPHYIENDVNLASVGEMAIRRREGKNVNICYLSLGSGFGSGIIINGHLWQGANNCAGEIGNMMLGFLKGKKTSMRDDLILENAINIEAINKHFSIDILSLSELDDSIRRDIMSFIIPTLSASIFNVAMLLDMDTFVLGGVIPELLGADFISELQTEVNEMLSSKRRYIAIMSPSMPQINLYGCANWVFENTLIAEFQKN